MVILDDAKDGKAKVHDNCRINFRNRIARKESQKVKFQDTKVDDDIVNVSDASCIVDSGKEPERRRSLRLNDKETIKVKQKCFICNVVNSCDELEHSKGGLARCELESSKETLLSSMRCKLADKKCSLYDAAKRLEILGSTRDFDLFAVDIYYHKKCYSLFTKNSQSSNANLADHANELENKVTELFLRKVEVKVCKDKEAFLLSDLITDLTDMCIEFGLDSTPITLRHTYQLKKVLLTELEDKITIVSYGKSDAVISKEMDPLAYSYATVRGNGLREEDVTKAFSNLVRRKIDKTDSPQWPPKPDEFLQSLKNSRPLNCIFNAIVWSLNPKRKLNENGYAETNSELQAEKISAITECWEGLLSKSKKPSQTAMSLTLHRLTGSKEATVLLNRCGMGIPYTDIRLLTNEWGKGVTQNYKKILRRKFSGQKSAHVTFDNSDGKQQTLTGFDTTHHTTGTIFQTGHTTLNDSTNEFRDFEFAENNDETTEVDYGRYKIPKKKESVQTFEAFSDKYKDSPLLKTALNRDLAWAIVNAIGSDCIK